MVTRDRLDGVGDARATAAATGGSPRARRASSGRAAPAAACPISARSRHCSPRPGRFASLRERLAAPRRHVGLTSIPHGAKSYLAAAIALAEDGERTGLDRPRRRDRRPGRGGARGVARRRRAGGRAGAADRTGLRAERAGRRRDGRPGRGAERVAERAGPDPRGQRPGARPAHDRAVGPAGRAADGSRSARGSARRRSSPSCSTSATRRRSRSPAAASSPAAAASSTCSRRRRRCRSGSSSSATRSTRCGVRPDRPAHRRPARGGGPAPRVGVPPAARGSGRAPRGARAAGPRSCPSGMAADLERFVARPRRGPCTSATPRPSRLRTATPPKSGRRSSLRRPGWTIADDTLFVIDEPGDVAEAADFLWRQADERRAELDRHGRPAEGLALDLRRPASLEVAAGREPHARADLGVRAARVGRAGGARAELRRRVRLARAGPARGSRSRDRRRGRWLAGRGSADRPRVGPGASPRRALSTRPAMPSP